MDNKWEEIEKLQHRINSSLSYQGLLKENKDGTIRCVLETNGFDHNDPVGRGRDIPCFFLQHSFPASSREEIEHLKMVVDQLLTLYDRMNEFDTTKFRVRNRLSYKGFEIQSVDFTHSNRCHRYLGENCFFLQCFMGLTNEELKIIDIQGFISFLLSK